MICQALLEFTVALVVTNPRASAEGVGDLGLIPGWEDSLE